jgi:hypothetical protein
MWVQEEVVAEGEYKYKIYSCKRERTITGICTEESTRDRNSFRRTAEKVVERRRAPEAVGAGRRVPEKVVEEREYKYKIDNFTGERTKIWIFTDESTRDGNSYRRRLGVT